METHWALSCENDGKMSRDVHLAEMTLQGTLPLVTVSGYTGSSHSPVKSADSIR